MRAAIARAARAGLSPAWQREAEAKLRQRDAAAVQRLSGCANATPFRMASYQNALETAARFKLCEHSPVIMLESPASIIPTKAVCGCHAPTKHACLK